MDAEDVVQEVIVEFWQKNKAMDVKSGLVAYITGAVKREALYVLRRKKLVSESSTVLLEDRDWSALPETLDGDAELVSHIMQFVQKQLPEKQREVVSYRMAGYTNAEIAQKMKISVKGVEINMTRALQSLRAEFTSSIPERIGISEDS